jgi:hypothetical protein
MADTGVPDTTTARNAQLVNLSTIILATSGEGVVEGKARDAFEVVQELAAMICFDALREYSFKVPPPKPPRAT